MLRLDHCWVVLFTLHISNAQIAECNVTFNGGQTLYSVPEFKATDCHYHWTNSSNHVLANHEAHTEELVVTKSNRSLLINGCSENILYRRDCISEGMPHEANCTVDCSANETQTNVKPRQHWCMVTICLLPLPLGLFLWYKCKNHT